MRRCRTRRRPGRDVVPSAEAVLEARPQSVLSTCSQNAVDGPHVEAEDRCPRGDLLEVLYRTPSTRASPMRRCSELGRCLFLGLSRLDSSMRPALPARPPGSLILPSEPAWWGMPDGARRPVARHSTQRLGPDNSASWVRRVEAARPTSDDASCALRRDPGAGREGLLNGGFACAHYVRCGRYGRYLDAEMTLVTLI